MKKLFLFLLFFNLVQTAFCDYIYCFKNQAGNTVITDQDPPSGVIPFRIIPCYGAPSHNFMVAGSIYAKETADSVTLTDDPGFYPDRENFKFLLDSGSGNRPTQIRYIQNNYDKNQQPEPETAEPAKGQPGEDQQNQSKERELATTFPPVKMGNITT